jgi:type II secretory pathway pseudopilin PulG
MKGHTRIPHTLSLRSERAFAMIVWVAVIAIIGILAAIILPLLISGKDFQVARDENTTLSVLATAFQDVVRRDAYIPAATNWADTIAVDAAMSMAAITNNPRGQPRILLIDTAGWFTNVTLPYTQMVAGNTNLPVNARMIIASSLGVPLPAALTNGPLNATNFSALWNAAEGTTNFPTTGVWAGWNGRSEDVKLQRIDLDPLFIGLQPLVTYPAPAGPLGLYSIGNDTNLYQAQYLNLSNPPPAAYYLQSTILRLYSDTAHLDSTQVLNQNGSFFYRDKIWQSGGGGAVPTGVDLSGVVFAFLNAVPNTQAANGGDQQRLVVQSMMNYMSNYIAWADGGFSDTTLKNYLLNTAQPGMIGTIQDLFQGSYYPTNASGPQ